MLGYPEAALADAARAVRDAREIGQAGTLMFALDICKSGHPSVAENTRAANALVDEVIALADEKSGAILEGARNV